LQAGQQPSTSDPFSGGTERTRVVKGRVHGIDLHFIDTPGLHVSAAGQARNYAVLRQIRGAFRAHKPDLVV
jgi:hypothetical protein